MISTTIDLSSVAQIHLNPPVDELIQHCVSADSCRQTDSGAVVAYSGKYTGRTPKDKFIIVDEKSEPNIWWDNNSQMAPALFESLRTKFQGYAEGKTLYIIDTFGGADPDHRIAVRFIVERPYHALFIKQLLIRPTEAELAEFKPDWTVVDFGKLILDPAVDHTRSDAVIALNIPKQEVLIAGTEYAGEMKKSVFTIMNYLLPLEGVLSMHCSSNLGHDGDTALFFGLSGTGKTTLSADPERYLIGDDEHGWTDKGVFNVEGGCYAKCINLSEQNEPEIYQAIRPGSILENVVLNAGGQPDYADASITENTRVAYPINFIPGALEPSTGGHPKNIIFLTCDAMGILPPIAKLTAEQAMYFFLNGYTAKVAGTEAGVTEPTAVFSTCFGAPFLPLRPKVYADLLGKKIEQHGSKVWLVNTGWTGGAYGTGSRMKLAHTRAMITAAFKGQFDNITFEKEPTFGLEIPTELDGIPTEILNPRSTWADKTAYDNSAAKLKQMFDENFKNFAH